MVSVLRKTLQELKMLLTRGNNRTCLLVSLILVSMMFGVYNYISLKDVSESLNAWSTNSLQLQFPNDGSRPVRNNTPPGAVLLIYNRVPKCGSRSLAYIITKLGQRNGYDMTTSKIHPRNKTRAEQEAVLEKALSGRKTSLHAWHGHAYFFDDFRDYNGTILWMNMIRDPVERFISHFFFMRTKSALGYHTKWLKHFGVNPSIYTSLELEICAKKGNPLCTWSVEPKKELQLTYFCGPQKACSELGNKWALQRALDNAERYYSVIGITEERSLSYSVFEAYMPKFFTGISEYVEEADIKLHVARPDDKKPVSEATRAILKNYHKEDYEFYEYIKQRLHRQAQSLGLL